MYSFVVEKAEDIDVQRICDECQEDDPDAVAILVTGGDGNRGLLLLRQSFLDRFTAEDGMVVGGGRLAPGWGFGWICISQMGHAGCRFSSNIYRPTTEYNRIRGWRCQVINLDAVDGAIQQLKEANEYIRQLRVKVHVLKI